MKPIVKKFFSVLTAGVMLCAPQTVIADDTVPPVFQSVRTESGTDAQEIAVNTDVTDSLADKDDENVYQFTVKDDGVISIDFSHPAIESSDYCWTMTICDTSSYQHQIYKKLYYGNETETVSSIEIGLAKGTYRVSVKSTPDGSYSGEDYTLQIHYKKTANTETEYNDTVGTADRLTVGTAYTGRINHHKDVDQYQFGVSEYGYINIEFSHPTLDTHNSIWEIRLYDIADNTNTHIFYNLYYGSAKKTVISPNIGLEKGTYIIELKAPNISPDQEYTDGDYAEKWYTTQYTLKVTFTEEENRETELNDKVEAADALAVNGQITGCAQKYKDTDWYTFTLDQAGTVYLDFSHEYAMEPSVLWRLDLFNGPKASDENRVWSDTYEGNGVNAPQEKITVKSPALELEAGTYYILISEPSVSYSVDYTIELRAPEMTGTATQTSATTTVTTTTVTTTTTAVSKLKGDANCDGKVTSADVELLSKVISGLADLSEQGQINADIVYDGTIDMKDIDKLKEILAQSDLPGDVDCSGMRDVADAVLLARFLTEDKDAEITQQGKLNADCNKSGKPDQEDVVLILKAIARLITL